MTHFVAPLGLVLVIVLVGLLALVAGCLARLVARDGLGSNPRPRSHVAELGTAADRELRR